MRVYFLLICFFNCLSYFNFVENSDDVIMWMSDWGISFYSIFQPCFRIIMHLVDFYGQGSRSNIGHSLHSIGFYIVIMMSMFFYLWASAYALIALQPVSNIFMLNLTQFRVLSRTLIYSCDQPTQVPGLALSWIS